MQNRHEDPRTVSTAHVLPVKRSDRVLPFWSQDHTPEQIVPLTFAPQMQNLVRQTMKRPEFTPDSCLTGENFECGL